MWKELTVILQIWITTEFIFTGGHFKTIYWKNGTHECFDVVCPQFNAEIIKIRPYLCNILKFYT